MVTLVSNMDLRVWRFMSRSGGQRMLRKHIGSTLFMVVVGLQLLGCGVLSTQTTPTTTTTSSSTTTTSTQTESTTTGYSILNQTLISGDVSDIEIIDVEGNFDGFGYSVDEIRYDAVTNKVIIRFTLHDPVDRDAVYGVSIFPKIGSGSSSTGVFVPNASPSQEFTFNIFSSANWYVVKLEKAYPHPVTNNIVKQESFRRLELRLVSFDEIHRIDAMRIDFKDYEYGEDTFTSAPEGHIYQDVNLSFLDPDLAVSELRIAFYEKQTGELCADKVVSVSTSRDSAGKATISNIRVSNLIPGMKYTVVAYASGNNGLRAYQGAEIVRSEFTTREYGFIASGSTLALYAYMTHHGIASNGFPIHVKLHNDETTLHPETNEPYAFYLRLKDKDKNVLWEQAMDNASDLDVVIPKSFLRIDASLVIEDSTGTKILAGTNIPFYKPTCQGDLRNIGSARYLDLICSEGDGTITGGTIEIYSGDTLITTIPYDKQMSQESVTLTLPSIEPNGQWVTAIIRLTYTAFDGVDEGLYVTTIR
jgi:hypothetical protein